MTKTSIIGGETSLQIAKDYIITEDEYEFDSDENNMTYESDGSQNSYQSNMSNASQINLNENNNAKKDENNKNKTIENNLKNTDTNNKKQNNQNNILNIENNINNNAQSMKQNDNENNCKNDIMDPNNQQSNNHNAPPKKEEPIEKQNKSQLLSLANSLKKLPKNKLTQVHNLANTLTLDIFTIIMQAYNLEMGEIQSIYYQYKD